MKTDVVSDNQIPVACFAPPLTDETIARYESLINSLGSELIAVKDSMKECLDCVKSWWSLPESTRTDVKKWTIQHRGNSVSYNEVPLEEKHVEALWDKVPYMHECKAMESLFEELPSGTLESTTEKEVEFKTENGTKKEKVQVPLIRVIDQSAYDLRNTAFHLLWFAKELTLNREPLTLDKLPS